MTNYEIAQEINERIGMNPIPFDSAGDYVVKNNLD